MEQLIEAVRCHSVLWDSRLPDYRDTNAREKAWIDIATGLGKERKAVKGEWRKLRDSHRNAVSRRHTNSGQAPEKRKKWRYEDQMEFLLATNKHREDKTNTLPFATLVDEEGTPATPDNGDDEEATDNTTTFEQQGPSTELSRYQEKRLRDPRGTNKVLKYLTEKEKRKQTSKTPDELDLFFASITQSVRQLPRHVQLRLKREILNTVTLAEEEQELMPTSHHTVGHTAPYLQSTSKTQYRSGSNSSANSSSTYPTDLSPQSQQWHNSGNAELFLQQDNQ